MIHRFWERVDMSGDCWLWTGTLGRKGYGRVPNYPMSPWAAHRVAYMLAVGPIPGDLLVLHRCDNPPCVRPDHLFLGTNADNMRDMRAKGRAHEQITTHCRNGHAYAEHGFTRPSDPTQLRRCRACRHEQQRRYRNGRALRLTQVAA